jgi:transcriptional regulator with PAS, ATPase and Fis domain
LPPLRERPEDVLTLTEHFIAHFNGQLRRRVRGLTPAVADIFRRYPWPGNVRELRNVIERVMILEDDDLITTTYLPRGLAPDEAGGGTRTEASGRAQSGAETQGGDLARRFQLPGEGIALEEVEMSLVRQAMARSGGNQTRAAELLGITRDQLRYRLKKTDEMS